ncbi:uncharacterized protein plekhg6 isoform X2 [Gadus chalcogrammus]|uniref:uncharacterized protein plekhg6 isoform X2 n=1 Tax=Gadus chalcogrammus TaxID=1042646 RepID=UPI0024C4743D|nr:uncharacterized protein plekhg6 isoform X2 [Gadus chalcogrammus]
MDTAKQSLSSKASHVNNGEGSGQAQDEAAAQWADRGGGLEWQKDQDTAEMDSVDGILTADPLLVHRGSENVKHKFHSMAYTPSVCVFQRRTKQKVVTNFATVKGISAASKPRAALKQVLFSQGVSDKNNVPEDRVQVEALKQALQAYRVPADLRWVWEGPGQGTTLENSWTDIVKSHSTMSKIQRHQQEALWEFVHTELTYINKLTVIKDLVIAALVNLQQHGFLLEITPRSLFSNLSLILNAHRQFWQEVIYPMLQEVRWTGMPFDPRSLEAGCLQFSERFSSYIPYCWEQENTLEFAKRQIDTNPHFVVYLKWVETHPQCNRMRLGDMQAKPHQRITKYPLLLKAVLKNTPDPDLQQTIRDMLSSVNGFLETINDYLRCMDEEHALSISAQRLEGYEVPGINEEIDKHIREFCHFDLTLPMVGVGPTFVRKLLLEENLKMRGGKDSKEEVVALLFSDVLLISKVQKKVERLKVARPPLALDRTCCVPLKDGFSFLLVEVSELGCAMNVYIFVTATAVSCSKWVSTIHQAKATLKTLKEVETSRQLDSQRIQPSYTKPIEEAKEETMETINEHVEQSADDTILHQPSVEPLKIQSGNGLFKLPSLPVAIQPSTYLPVNDSDTIPTPQFKATEPQSKSLSISSSKPLDNKTPEWIEKQVKQRADEEVEVVFLGSEERRVTWNHNKTSAADNLRSKPKDGKNPFIGKYPEVDYPTVEPVAPPKDHLLSNSPNSFEEVPSSPVGGTTRPMKTGYNIQLVDHKVWTDPGKSLSTDVAFLEVGRFSRKLKSPRLRRRTQHVDAYQTHGTVFGESEMVWTTPPTNSSSNSDSDSSQKLQGHFDQRHTNNDTSLRVLKLGFLKTHPALFLNMYENHVSPEPETFSEPELPQELPEERNSVKAQRSASIPDIHKLHATSTSPVLRTYIGERSPRFNRHPHAHVSPVEGLLERAKVRVRREGGQTGRNENVQDTRTWIPPPSPPLFSESLCPSPSDGDREVELMRHRVPTVSQGWREQLVDGDAEDKKYSHIFVNELSVDWPALCFDDDQDIDHLEPIDVSNEGTGILEDIQRTLTTLNIRRVQESKISQV